jgi:predicted metal-binding membrane protein
MIAAARLYTHRSTRLIVVGLVCSAWAILAVWSTSPYAELLSHTGLAVGAQSIAPLPSPVLRVAAFGAGWALMSVAMMLPGSLPLLERVSVGAQFIAPLARPQRNRRLAQFIVGYLLVWLAFGWAAYLGDMVLHAAVEHVSWLHQASGGIMAAVLLTAGVYQFSPLKRHHLENSRASHTIPSANLDALRLGLTHGLMCLGNCWALMLLMFALCGMNLGWMLLLGALMTAERATAWGQRLARFIGVVLLLSAVLHFAGTVTFATNPTPEAPAHVRGH